MNIIKTLTDKELLGSAGLSRKKPRITARAILQNGQQKLAVMYSAKYDLYSLPGGGVEEGEDILTALRREVQEETGCTCGAIRELGIVHENRGVLDYTQLNYYYVVKVAKDGVPQLTEAEQQSKTTVQWHSFDDAKRLITNQQFERIQGKYLVARDVTALEEYEKSGLYNI